MVGEAVFVKLGGSVATVKSSDEPEARTDLIGEFADDVARLVDRGLGIVVANGAGSFGHPMAARAGLHRGLGPGSLPAAAETAASVSRLNAAVVDALLSRGVPAISLPPRAYVYGDGDGWVAWTEPFRLALEFGFVPSTFGDVVLHAQRGVAIFSADDVPLVLGDLVGRAVFLVDVPGVLGPGGEVLREVSPGEVPAAGYSGAADVTGGMAAKLSKGFELARRGVEVRVAGFRGRGDLIRALEGEAGTLLLPGG